MLEIRKAPIRWNSSLLALVVGLGAPAQVFAQRAALPATEAVAASNDDDQSTVTVTATRVDRAGFDAPTPTTVLGPIDLRLGNRATIGDVLNDLPEFRGTTQPVTLPGNPQAGTFIPDLRGLNGGSTTIRTLSLLNGHRFIGSNDLNNVPAALIKRVDVVTGGASAAWGSGAIAGVVNFILDDDLKGLTLGADAGIASRGDAARYSFKASYGTGFADGRGHFMIAGEYLDEEGTAPRNNGDRPNIDAALFTTTAGQIMLARDVNSIVTTPGGVIRTGPLAGQSFNSDGSLSPLSTGSMTNATQTIGGTGRSNSDHYPALQPYKRYNSFARASFAFSDAVHLWAEAGFTRMQSSIALFPETPTLTISRDNAYLTSAQRSALGATASFSLGRTLDDIGPQGWFGQRYQRDNIEGTVGAEGSLGGSWKYNAYYDHGQYEITNGATNQRITSNFNNALDSVISPTTGQPVCRIALANPATDCRPLNLFGSRNASSAAIAYAFGDATDKVINKLDVVAGSIQGEPLSIWAGPISVVFGGEYRRETTATHDIDALSRAAGFAFNNYVPLNGKFSVKEGFGEIVVPLVNQDNVIVNVNGAARYSDYSTSGGIWSWKYGGTTRLFHDLLLRGAYSRDIRSPSITELYTTRSLGTGTIVDPTRANASAAILTYRGGDPTLHPETSHTLTLGGTYSPSFVRGLQLSIDYFNIKIDQAIGTLSAQDTVTQCAMGKAVACANIVRNAGGVITTVYLTSANLAYYKTRGIDFEASYTLPLSSIANIPGSVRFRALATHVSKMEINDGVNIYDRAGDVGDSGIPFATPKWRATGSMAYDSNKLGGDLRVRFVDGGTYNHLLAITNNQFSSRTYVDLGIHVNAGQMTFNVNVDNLFDRDPPLVVFASPFYDMIGRYVSVGAKVKF